MAEALDRLTEELRSLRSDLRSSGFKVRVPTDGMAARGLQAVDEVLKTAKSIDQNLSRAASRGGILGGIVSAAAAQSELDRLAGSIDRCRDAVREVRRDVVRP